MAGLKITNVLYWLALALYLGGLLALGAIVAPMLFAQAETLHLQPASMPAFLLDAHTPARLAAGDLFGAMMSRFTLVAEICAGVLLVLTLLQMWVFHAADTGWSWFRKALLALLVLTLWYSAHTVRPEMDKELLAWRTATVQQDAQTHRTTFNQLHGKSEQLWWTQGALLALMALSLAWPQGAAEKNDTRSVPLAP